MTKAKEILQVLFRAKQQEVKEVEVPNIDFHPQLLEYLENGWAELVKGQDGEPYLIDGKRLYQIVDLENGFKYSRIVQLNNLFEQSKEIGMTGKNLDFNMGNIEMYANSIEKNENNREGLIQIRDAILRTVQGYKLCRETGLGDDLVYSISALAFVLQNEDPTDFNEKEYRQRITAFRNNELAFFFYTHSFKLLSASLKVYMTDMESFMKEVLQNSLSVMKVKAQDLNLSLRSNSISISDIQLGCLEKQVETTNVRIKCLEGMLWNFTIGSMPLEK